LTKILSVLG